MASSKFVEERYGRVERERVKLNEIEKRWLMTMIELKRRRISSSESSDDGEYDTH